MQWTLAKVLRTRFIRHTLSLQVFACSMAKYAVSLQMLDVLRRRTYTGKDSRHIQYPYTSQWKSIRGRCCSCEALPFGQAKTHPAAPARLTEYTPCQHVRRLMYWSQPGSQCCCRRSCISECRRSTIASSIFPTRLIEPRYAEDLARLSSGVFSRASVPA